MTAAAEPRAAADPLGRFGVRLGRETILYASASVSSFVFAMANVAVLTRFLAIGEFGRLSLYLLFSTLLTIVCNLGSLQGTFMSVYGASADEGATDSEEDAPDRLDPGSALTTGLAVTAATGAAAVVFVLLAANPVERLLLGHPGAPVALTLAATAGATGSLWRFTVNVLRMERRPVAFAVLNGSRPALVVGASGGLVATGHGIEGAIAGPAFANVAATAVALVLTRRAYRLAFAPQLVPRLWARGAYTVPLVLAVWVVQSADLYLVSIFAPDAEVARYRVASRIGAGMSYFVSAFMMAWGPLASTTLYAAAERGRKGRTGGALVTIFLFVALWLTLMLGAAGDILISIAPGSYAAAAPLIPVVGMGFVTFGVFTIVHRVGRFPQKRRRVAMFATLAAVLFVGSGVVLVPPLGAYGAPLAQIVGFGGVAALMLFATQRSTKPIPLDGRRVTTAIVVAAVLLAIGELLPDAVGGSSRTAIGIAAVVAYPVILFLSGALPLAQLRTALRSFRSAPSSREIVAAVRAQPPERARALELLLRERRPPADAAAALSRSVDAVLTDATRGLRAVTGGQDDCDADAEIGAYLFGGWTVADRNQLARRLWARGADPLDVTAMEDVLRRMRRRPWRARW